MLTARRRNEVDPLIRKLVGINTVPRHLLVAECAGAGTTNADVTKIVRVDANRVTRISKHIKIKSRD